MDISGSDNRMKINLVLNIFLTIFICAVYQLSINWYFIYLAILSLTGLVIGSIVGLLIGYYYKKKDVKAKYSMDDEFYQGLIVK